MSDYLGCLTSDVVDGSQLPPGAVTVGASPFSYSAPSRGSVNVSGGTVSQVAIVRNGVSHNIGGIAGSFQVSKGDQIKVTYSAAPSLTFIPH